MVLGMSFIGKSALLPARWSPASRTTGPAATMVGGDELGFLVSLALFEKIPTPYRSPLRR
jgi:hypothetical protein